MILVCYCPRWMYDMYYGRALYKNDSRPTINIFFFLLNDLIIILETYQLQAIKLSKLHRNIYV